MTEQLKTGTTTLAIICKDGIVTAADKRATAGSLVVQNDITKVVPLTKNLVVTIAGSVSDIQLLTKYIKAELKINTLRMGRDNTVKEAANLLGGFVYSGIRTSGSITHFLLSGVDKEGYHVYDIFPDGSVNKINKYITSGSGSIFALGLLDGNYQEGINLDQGVALAKKAINSALVRDTGSGNGADIFTVTHEGVKHVETIVVNTGIPQ